MHVHGIPPSQTAVYQKLFTAIDKDADQKISLDELQAARNTLPSQAKGAAKGHSVGKLFAKLNVNGDGFLTPDEMTPRLSRGAFSVLLAAQEHAGGLSQGGIDAIGGAPPAGVDPPPPVTDPVVTPPGPDLGLAPPTTVDATPPSAGAVS